MPSASLNRYLKDYTLRSLISASKMRNRTTFLMVVVDGGGGG